jgi:hypothetical protein
MRVTQNLLTQVFLIKNYLQELEFGAQTLVCLIFKHYFLPAVFFSMALRQLKIRACIQCRQRFSGVCWSPHYHFRNDLIAIPKLCPRMTFFGGSKRWKSNGAIPELYGG